MNDTASGSSYVYDAFVSYSHLDGLFVREKLVASLEKDGLRICIDHRDFAIGVPSLVNIENAIRQSRKVLLVLSPSWVASEWTAFESLLIQTKDPAGNGRRIIPILFQNCELPPRLQLFSYLDLTDTLQFDFQMKRLLNTIRGAVVAESPAKSMPTRPSIHLSRGFDVTRGLSRFGERVHETDLETQLAFASLDARLRSNLTDEQLFGSSELIRNERNRIIYELNRLALVNLKLSFNDLCVIP